MRIQDFTDMDKFHEIMKNWAKATGLATVAVDMDGNYISDCFNFADFCIKYTRESAEGKRRCEKCDREGTGVYHCHAGLIDFSIDLVVKGEKSRSRYRWTGIAKRSGRREIPPGCKRIKY